MITRLSQILEQLHETEAAKLAQEDVEHGPTIGEMYEGLTKEVLERAIPQGLGLRLVDGFTVGPDGKRGPQSDALLVVGDKGRQIPRTTRWEWPIEDVIAVFEVKKTLYGAELSDSLKKMRAISEQQRQLLASESFEVGPLRTSQRAFARAMRRFPQANELEDFENAGGEILRTIAFEQLAPLRIVIGYEGYVDEYGLRQGLLEAIEKVKDGVAGPGVLPNLIICRRNTLLKLTGHPYVVPLRKDGRWDLVASERQSPYRMVLELIWTRLSNQFGTAFPLDDTLDTESLAPLLAGKPANVNGKRGWYLYTFELGRDQLAEVAGGRWEPTALSQGESILVLMALERGGFDLGNTDLQDAAVADNLDLAALAARLVDASLFAWVSDTCAEPIGDTIHHVIQPDGSMWASTNGELLHLWAGAAQSAATDA